MPFPKAIDSTILHSFITCATLCRLQFIDCLTPKAGINIHLLAGIAVAKGLEVARNAYHYGAPTAQAEAEGLKALLNVFKDPVIPEKIYKTWDRVACAYAAYLERWPLDSDYLKPLIIEGKPCLEFTFAFPLPIDNPDTGDPILYAGRCDWIATYQGSPFCVDEKTTGSLGSKWSNKWNLRGQFTGYAYAAGIYGYPVLGTIVRGVAIKKEDIDFGEAIIYQPAWKLTRWHLNTIRVVHRLVDAYKSDKWEYAYGDSCNDYGGCPMTDICTKEDPSPFVQMYYETKEWNPLLKSEDA